MKKCIRCNKEKTDNEFHAKWSHCCNACIEKSKKDREYEEFIKNDGIDGKENMMPLKTS